MKDELKKLRDQIDSIDDQIVELLAKRHDVVIKVGEIKKAHNITHPFDPKRFEEVIESNSKKAKAHGLSVNFIQKLFKLIHDHSVEVQKKQ